ncbi:hypothetical protein SAVERM_3260 [Streptomyces avermitilis MA-4680 = NBRC 14893]|uniref:Uncharacterized protein n=2 Tax=Streptomyces avermitilis TaxID=33903 RepID=Q82I98_STRAW|nr:hypothetical protein SAVERM_3260 [Streptomyces avermitilis MA-4680 = NBRC 14893]
MSFGPPPNTFDPPATLTDSRNSRSSRGRRERLRRALEGFGNVVWMRSPMERHPIYGYRQVSFASWRFEEPSDFLKTKFESLVQDTPTNLEWRFKAARNWMIAPARLVDQAGQGGEFFNEAVVSITEHDQEFCASAEEDLMQILITLEEGGGKS